MVENQTELTSNTPTNPEINQTPTPLPKSKFPIVISIVIFFLLFVVAAGAYYLGTRKTSLVKSNQNSDTSSFEVTPTETKVEAPLFSGKLQKIDHDLKIIKQMNDGSDSKVSYYSVGVFNQGELSGYTRVIAVSGYGPSLITYTFATKDFQTYILDDPDQSTTKYPEDDWQNPYSKIDKTKINATKTLDTYHPTSIKLDNNFNLSLQDIPINSHQTNEKDILGNILYEYLINTDFSKYQILNSPDKNLTLYYQPISRPEYFDQWDQASKDRQIIREKFITTTSRIIVVDPTGLPMNYLLSFNQSSTLSFTKNNIKNSNISSFYTNYDAAIPGGCAITSETVVTKFADNDFEKIGTVFDNPIFKLKDSNNEFYKLAYSNKLDYYNNYDKDNVEWNSLNNNLKKPNLQEYIQNTPLLFVKDYWQRWVAVGEYDIRLPGGCGKPVIYLYPPKITKVSVKFNIPVQLTTDIPKYDGSWQILAQSDGSLKNLNSNQSSCRQIDFTKRGSEYAKKACETNNYPYLYWAGNVYSQEYPTIDKGWIVAKNDLNNFLQNKLSEIGLNQKEKKDFIEYWLSDMLTKNSPYYRLSFLQTSQLNSLFPMTVNPKPDTVFRIFLDYLPLDQKPVKEILPQSLNKLIRYGFTLVEWGGLKRY